MYSKFDKTYKPTNPGRSMIPKCIKENYQRKHPGQISWTVSKGNTLKTSKGKMQCVERTLEREKAKKPTKDTVEL